jgi:hypothetical protein
MGTDCPGHVGTCPRGTKGQDTPVYTGGCPLSPVPPPELEVVWSQAMFRAGLVPSLSSWPESGPTSRGDILSRRNGRRGLRAQREQSNEQHES